MSIPSGSVDLLYLVLKNSTEDEILRMLEQDVDLNGRYDVIGDTVYHLILRNKNLQERQIIAISRIFRERGVDPAAMNRNAKAPLHLAIENRTREVADFFVNYNPWLAKSPRAVTRFFVEDENQRFWQQARRRYDDLALWHSERAEIESAEFLEWLIVNQRSDADPDDEEELMLLHLAVDCNLQHLLPVLLRHASERSIVDPEHEPLLHLFLNKCASVRRAQSKWHARNWYDRYVSRYIRDILTISLEKGAVVGAPSVRLVLEARAGIGIVKTLVDRFHGDCDEGVLNGLIGYPRPVLEASSLESYLAVLRDLLAKSANVDAPLRGIARAILWLTEIGAEFAVTRTPDGEHSLHSLVFRDSTEALSSREFLGSAALVNGTFKDGSAPLHSAVKHGNVQLLRKLIEHGAEVNCRDRGRRTPLHFAVMDIDTPEMAETLLENGANPNARDASGECPLVRAIWTVDWRYLDEEQLRCRSQSGLSHEGFLFKKIRMLRALLNRGARVSGLRDQEARDTRAEIAEVLLEHGLALDDSVLCRTLFDSCRSLLVRHWIKLYAANLPCASTRCEDVAQRDEYQRCYEECLKEAETLKDTFVDSRTSLYRFLHMDPNRKCMHVHNEKLKRLVESTTIKEQFPRYAVLVLAGYHEAVARQALMEPAKEAWLRLTEICLPDICIERVLAYLSNADLLDMTGTD